MGEEPAKEEHSAPKSGVKTKRKAGDFIKAGEFVNPTKRCIAGKPHYVCRGTSVGVTKWKRYANYTCDCGFQTTGVSAPVYEAAKKSGLVS